jgi:hypothetical protein
LKHYKLKGVILYNPFSQSYIRLNLFELIGASSLTALIKTLMQYFASKEYLSIQLSKLNVS